MSVSFNWWQTVGTTALPTELNATNLNMGNTYTTGNINPQEFPITCGSNSYELWFRPRFIGTFTQIDNIYFAYVSGTLLSGESLFVRTISPSGLNYQTPTKQDSTIAVSGFPMGTSSQVGISGSTTTKLLSNANNSTSGAFADYIVCQIRTSTNTVAGMDNTKTFQISYDVV